MSKISKHAKRPKNAPSQKRAPMPKITQMQKSNLTPKSSTILKSDGECCPGFDPHRWDGKEITFDHKWFAKEHVTSFFHMPLNFGSVVERVMKQARAMGSEANEALILFDEGSAFGSEAYFAVKKNTPGLVCGTISGKFSTKVFEGPYSNMGKWIEEMKVYVNAKGKGVMRMLFFYPRCSACAKKAGKNYVVIFAQTE